MGFLSDKWNKNNFSIYDSEEKSVLKLFENMKNFLGNDLIKEVENKTNLTGNHLGQWQGIERPTLSEEGLRGTVEKHITDINNINVNISSIDKQVKYNVVVETELTQISIENIVNNTLNKKNGVIKLRNGVYNLSNLKFSGIQNIKFVGGQNTVFKNINLSTSIIQIDSSENITFENITFDGGYDNIIPSEYGNIAIQYSSNSYGLTIDKCIFKNVNDCAINDKTQSSLSSEFIISTDSKIANTIIVNNRFYNCKHSYLAKSGGSRNIVYSNNIHYNCKVGVKVDGETFYNSIDKWTTYPNKTGRYIITNNLFTDSLGYGGGSGMVVIEEYSEDVIISNNIFKKLNNVDGICITQGQSIQNSENILISNNIFDDIKNSYGVSLRLESDKNISIKNIKINDNIFRDNKLTSIFIKGYLGGEISNININNNLFDEKNNGLVNNFIINFEGDELTKFDNIIIEQNEFLGNDNSFTSSTSNGFLRLNKISSNKRKVIIKNNKFRYEGTINKNIGMYNSDCTLIDNIFENLIIDIGGTKTDFIENDVFSSYLMLSSLNNKTCDSYFKNNIYTKGNNINNYCVRINDGGTHIGKNNEYDILFTSPMYKANGSYSETGNYVIYANNKHYKLNVDSNGILNTTEIII